MKKNRLSAVIAACMGVIVFVSLTMFASGARVKGDLDGNGSVSTGEARSILRVAVQLDEAFTDEELVIADMNDDGLIQSNDARLALRVAVKLDEPSEIEESTTEEPEESSSTPIPTAPTDPSTDPSEPVVTDPTDPTAPSEPAVTDPTDPTEPSEPAVTDPTEPAVAYTVDEECYVKATIYTYSGDTESVATVESAHESETHTVGIVNTREVVTHKYFNRSADLFNGADVGVIIEEELNLVNNVESSMYLLNYTTNQYVGINPEVLSTLAGMLGEEFVMPDLEGAVITVRTYDSLDGVDGETEVVDGVEYFVVTETTENGGYQKYYLLQHEGRDFYQADIVEGYTAEDVLTARMVIDEYNPDPSGYFSRDNMSEVSLFDIAALTEFMESLNMKTTA